MAEIPGTFSFSTPCLRWKLIAGLKQQYGFPGILTPSQTRYLNLTATVTTDESVFGGGTTVVSGSYTVDRFTGLLTSTAPPGFPLYNFPYNSGLPGSDPGSTWIIDSDTHYQHIVTQDDGVVITVDVTMSTPYDLSTLEADADALIAAIDPANVAWFTLQMNPTDLFDFNSGANALPAQYLYQLTQNPMPLPKLGAAAFSVLSLGVVGPANWTPNVYLKAIGYVAMAGKYCENTVLLDYNGNQISDTCASGIGACNNEFEVKPPDLVYGQNAYVLVTPNCQCPH